MLQYIPPEINIIKKRKRINQIYIIKSKKFKVLNKSFTSSKSKPKRNRSLVEII